MLRWSFGSLLVVLVLQSADARARDICWIDRVKRTAKGVDVYFSDLRNVSLNRPGVEVRRYLAYPANADRVRVYDNETPVEAVPAVVGDRLFSHNSPHDSCSLTVVMKDGKIGLEANASMQMGGLPPDTVKKFIPAE